MSNELAQLKREHRELDTRIKKLGKKPGTCTLELGELKKKKLALKQQMQKLAKQLVEPELQKQAAQPPALVHQLPQPAEIDLDMKKVA